MKLPRRQFLHPAAGAAALPAVSRITWAQAYPSRPVRIIVGFAPGGATDIMARLMGQSLSERLGQQFVIENRPGADSNVGTEAVVNAAPDGYTLLVVTSVNAINASLRLTPRFRQVRRRRNREVGEGGEVRGHQGGLNRGWGKIFRNARSAKSRCSAEPTVTE
jgi:hypothetical protein